MQPQPRQRKRGMNEMTPMTETECAGSLCARCDAPATVWVNLKYDDCCDATHNVPFCAACAAL